MFQFVLARPAADCTLDRMVTGLTKGWGEDFCVAESNLT